MLKKRRIIISLAAGLGAEAVNKLFPLLSLHYAANAIGVHGFGYAQFGSWLVDVAAFLVAFGFSSEGAIAIGRTAESKDKIRGIVSEILVLRVVHALLGLFLLQAVIAYIPNYRPYADVVQLLSFLILSSAVDMTHVLVGTQRMLSLVVISVVAKVASLAGIFLFVHRPEDASLYAVLTVGANALISVGTAVVVLKRYPIVAPSFADLKNRWMSALPFAISLYLLVFLDRCGLFLVEFFQGTNGAGLYAGPVRLVQSVLPFAGAVTSVFFSEMVVHADKQVLTKHFHLGLKIILLLVLPMVIGVWFVADDLLRLVLGADFAGQGRVFSTLMLCFLGQALIMSYGQQVLLLFRHVHTYNTCLLIGGLLTCVIAFVVVPDQGLIGAATAEAIGRLSCGALIIYFARHLLVPLPMISWLRAIAPSIVMLIALLLAGTQSLIATLFLAITVYAVALAATNRSEIDFLIARIRQRL